MVIFAQCSSGLATAAQLFVGLAGIIVAAVAVWINNSIRKTRVTAKRMELIAKLYDTFTVNDELFDLYERVRKGHPAIDWSNTPSDERLLNKSLTVFDAIAYLQSQGLLDEREWEYIATEIQYFASNPSVCAYIVSRFDEGKAKGFHDDIIPFTGFPLLLYSIPENFRGKDYPCPPEYKEFFDKRNVRK